MRIPGLVLALICFLAGNPSAAEDPDQAVRDKLQTLWTMETANIIGADVLAGFIPGNQEKLVDFAGGEENVKYYMLMGAVVYEIPISMIFLSKYLPYQANRWTQVGAAATTALLVLGAGSTEPHYIAMASFQVLTLSYVTYTALTWKRPDPKVQSLLLHHDLGTIADPMTGEYGLRYSYTF